MSVGSRGSSHFSTASAQSGSSGNELAGGELSDGVSHQSSNSNVLNKTYRERTQAWWSVGEYLENGRTKPLTHQSAKLTLTGNRVFGNNYTEDLWDLSDSLLELYEANQNANLNATLQLTKKSKILDRDINVQEWLAKDTTHGFIRVYAPDVQYSKSQLVPCTLSTSAHKICLILGISLNALHVQLNGDVIRRLDPYEHPLVLQNEYLAGLGFNDIIRIQEEGPSEDLGYLIRFYAGKPFHDSTFSRNQLQAYIDVKKGKVISGWTKRLCCISGTRLLVYKDKFKRTKPTVFQLAKGSVEEVKFKGHDYCLKITSTLEGEKIICLSFREPAEHDRWFKKCKKATDKLPSSADLSNCHLEFLPETIFINDQLAMLNLRHNVLKERPIEEDIYTIGWIDDLPRFQCLRSLNLANNNLVQFPLSLCFIKTLVELNIASNKLEEIPSEIAELVNLQALHVHNNHLRDLPDDLVGLRKLFILVLAFNRFEKIPPVAAQMTDVRISDVENIIMAGNGIKALPHELVTKMKYAKKVDFRMNQLLLTPEETSKFTLLEHLTHLDIRDNKVGDIDLKALKTLEYLNCGRNEISSIQINGLSLKNFFAPHNCIEKLTVSPKPEWLLQIDVAHNQLRRLPEWLCDCFFLQKVNASHNQLVEIPPRLLQDAKKLKSLRVNHNKLESLPPDVDNNFIEEMYFQHNLLNSLPRHLLSRSNKLRVLNCTKNKLSQLPPLNENSDLNKVQELHLTGNNLGDTAMEVISGYARLKVLHIAYNEIHELYDDDIEKLELLQELNISGNQLKFLPDALGNLTKLVVLRAHSNLLTNLPDFKKATALRVLDVGHNHLMNVSVTNLMASQINLLDMSLNAGLKVDPREFKTIKNRKSVCLVDLTGQNRRLPGLAPKVDPPPDAPEESDLDESTPWKAGFSETSGSRNKLCVATLKMLQFQTEDEAVFAMFDGGHNNEVPKRLVKIVPEVLKEELKHQKTGEKYMKYTMLSAHRRLGSCGQRLGASVVLCHIRRISTNQMNTYTLQLANVGDVETVLCRRGDAVLLTQKFSTSVNRDECERIYKADGIITEDNKVGGTTKNTRQLGCAYLYPHIIPDPYTTTVALRHDDEFIIIGNRGLWKFVGYEEAVEEVYEIGNPVVAAKHLQDLAQSYGSKENIAVLVIRLNTESRPSLGRLRNRNRSMSIDDVEAAAQHEAKKLNEMSSALRASTGKIKQEANGVYVEKKKVREETKLEVKEPTKKEEVEREKTEETNKLDEVNNNDETQEQTFNFVGEAINIESSQRPQRANVPRSKSPPRSLKPLPKQRFRKKNAASEWEAVLQKRLTGEVKERELEQSVSQILATSSTNNVVADRNALVPVEIDAFDGAQNDGALTNATSEESWSSVHRKRSMEFINENNKFGSLRRRTTTPAWLDSMEGNVSTANPAYSYTKEIDDSAVITMTTAGKDRRQPKVRKTIAMFENISRDHMVPEPRYIKRGISPGRSASPGRPVSPGPGRGPSPARVLSPARGLSPARSPPNGHVIQAGIRPAMNGTSSSPSGVPQRVSRRDMPERTPQSSRSDVVSSHSTIVKVDSSPGYSSNKDDTQVFTIVNKVGNDSCVSSNVEDEQSVTVVEIARL